MRHTPPISDSFSGVPEGVLRVRSGFRPLEAPGREVVLLEVPSRTRVAATAPGEVIARLWNDPAVGHAVRVDHGADARGVSWMTDYLFLSEVSVRQWTTVVAGQDLGRSGLTRLADSHGRTHRPALGFVMWRNGRPVDPLPLLDWRPFELHVPEVGGWRCYFRPERWDRPQTAAQWQRAMVAAGLHLGAGGSAGDGVDGVWSDLDQYVLEMFQAQHELSIGRRDRATADLLIRLAREQRQAA